MAIIRRRRRRRRGGFLGFVAKLGAAIWVGRLVGRTLPAARIQATGRAAPSGQAIALADEQGVRYAAASRPEVVEVKSPAELEGRADFRAPAPGSAVGGRTLGATRAEEEDWVARREQGPGDGG